MSGGEYSKYVVILQNVIRIIELQAAADLTARLRK